MVQASLRSVVAFAGYNLVLGSVSARTDNAAHIGGLVAGLLCGALIAVLAPGENAAIRRFTILSLIALLLTGGAYGVSEYRGYVVHVGRGENFLAENNIPAAIKELEKAVRQRPNEADTHILLGAAYMQNKQEDRAEGEFMRAFQIDPNNESAGYWVAETYLKKRDFEAAKKIYQNALKRDQENAYAHFGLGRIYGEQRDFESAIREYETAASLDEELESVYYEIGNCYAKMNRHDEAIAAFQREVRDVGDYPELQLALAASYDAKGMKQLASEARAKAEKLKSEQKTE
jgi:tetratricopeptide (TPR) repeat protein